MGVLIAPAAQPDDGLVDVVISYAVGPVARLGYAVHLRRGDHVQRDDVHVTLAHTVTVSGQPFPWNADGSSALRYAAAPGSSSAAPGSSWSPGPLTVAARGGRGGPRTADPSRPSRGPLTVAAVAAVPGPLTVAVRR